MGNYTGFSATRTKLYTGRRCVGSVKDGVWRKRIRYSIHALRHPPALAFSKTSISDAQKSGCQIVEVFDEEAGRFFTTTLQKILDEGFDVQRGGFEEQLALKINLWDVSYRRPARENKEYLEDEFDEWS